MKEHTCTNRFSFYLGRTVTRSSLGLPDDWDTVEDWCKKPFQFGFPISQHQERKDSKWASLDCSKKAPKEFWEKFPSRPLPQQPTTRVNVPELKTAINMAAGQWTVHQKEAAARVVKNLVEGAPAYQQKQLKGGLMRNAPSAIQHGAAFTDTLEKWIKDGFVAGPFLSPQLPEI